MHRTFLKTGDRWSTFLEISFTNKTVALSLFSAKFTILRIRCSDSDSWCDWRFPTDCSSSIGLQKYLAVDQVSVECCFISRLVIDTKGGSWTLIVFKRTQKKIRHCGYLELKYISDAHIVRSTVFSIVCEKCPCYQKSVLWIVGEIGAWN